MLHSVLTPLRMLYQSPQTYRRKWRRQEQAPSPLCVDLQHLDLHVPGEPPAPCTLIRNGPKSDAAEWIYLSSLEAPALRVVGGLILELERLVAPVFSLYTPKHLAAEVGMLDEYFRELYWETQDEYLEHQQAITWTHIAAVEAHGLTPKTSLHFAPLLDPLHHQAVSVEVLSTYPERYTQAAPRLPEVLRTLEILRGITTGLQPEHDIHAYHKALEEHEELNDWRDPVFLFTLAAVDEHLYEVMNDLYQQAMQYGERPPTVIYDEAREQDKIAQWHRVSRSVLQLTQAVVRNLQRIDQPC